MWSSPRPAGRAAAAAGAPMGPQSVGGLAVAERRLATMQLTSGEMQVQREITKLRVDYLSELCTQTLLLAGMVGAMLGSLELEAIQPEDAHESIWQMFIVCAYIAGTCTALGSAMWVLYTSNNLINLATAATLYASGLEELQGADRVIGLRMLDVRAAYLLALFLTISSALIQVANLIDGRVAAAGALVVAALMVHAVHADYVTSASLHSPTFNLHMRTEHALEERLFAFLSRCTGRAYERLREFDPWRERLAEEKSVRDRASARRREAHFDAHAGATREVRSVRAVQSFWRRARGKHGAAPRAASAPIMARAGVMYGWLNKTPSSRGPCAVLRSMAIDRAANPFAVGGADQSRNLIGILRGMPANTPASRRWWVLERGVLSCHVSDVAWRSGEPSKLDIHLRDYTAVSCRNANSLLCIALLPKAELGREASRPSGGVEGRSWYLCAAPATLENSHITVEWHTRIAEACDANAGTLRGR